MRIPSISYPTTIPHLIQQFSFPITTITASTQVPIVLLTMYPLHTNYYLQLG